MPPQQASGSGGHGQEFPRVPAHAWSWLQRSRPVLADVAQRLTGQPPTAEFVEGLRTRFAEDPFTRAIVCEVVAEVAFSGRVPPRRPPGASWDRGLVWWAATLSGTTPGDYERPPASGTQAVLFAERNDPAAPAAAALTGGSASAVGPDLRSRGHAGRPGPAAPPRGERAAHAAALRGLLAASDGRSVPAEAVRRLLADLERD